MLDEQGSLLPHPLTIEFGAAGSNEPITNWGRVAQATHVNAEAPQGAGNSSLMNDMLWSRDGEREQGGVRIGGLPPGRYEVFALLRHFAAPETDRYAWAIGANLDRVHGHSFTCRGGSRSAWVEAGPARPGNYARRQVRIEGPDDHLTMIYDNLDKSFTEVMGFQVARVAGPADPGGSFRIQFDAGGQGHVPRITRNILDRLSR